MTNTDNGQISVFSVIRDAVNGISNLLTKNHEELVNHFRIPTPQKATFNVVADNLGVIGGGLTSPNPVTIYQCPMGSEAWIHRAAITSPQGQPKSPLTTGQLMCISGSGELMFFLPVSGQVAPVVVLSEGRASAPHLNAGSRLAVYGDSFPANCSLRFDLQIILTTGISQYTPRRQHEQPLVDIS